VGVDARRMRVVEAGLEKRPVWDRMVEAAEKLPNGKWATMAERYGDWRRDRTMAVAVAARELGWRLVDAVKAEDCVEYAAAVQGARRFWYRAAQDGGMKRFVSDIVVEGSERQ
jgi:urease accessory protein UreF